MRNPYSLAVSGKNPYAYKRPKHVTHTQPRMWSWWNGYYYQWIWEKNRWKKMIRAP
jgi:hypothetical protein